MLSISLRHGCAFCNLLEIKKLHFFPHPNCSMWVLKSVLFFLPQRAQRAQRETNDFLSVILCVLCG